MSEPVILVIRRDDRFSSTLRDAGFDIVNLELVQTRPLDDLSELRTKLASLNEYDGLFFTSPVAAQIFVEERNKNNGFHGPVYALGRRASEVLTDNGLTVKSSDAVNTAAELLADFDRSEFLGKRFLFIRGDKSIQTIPRVLGELATIEEVVVYKTDPADVDEVVIDNIRNRLFSNGKIGWVCFFSPSGVERFDELFHDATRNIKAAAIGATTAEAVRQSGYRVEFVSARSDAEEFANGLIEHIKRSE
jgi:uroporphyrinogen-III synthase